MKPRSQESTGPHSELNPDCILQPYLFQTHFNSPLFSHLHLDLSSDLIPCGFTTKSLYVYLILPMCATYSTQTVALHLNS